MAVRDYHIPLFPASAFAHPLRADMLAGHLCWYFAQADGAAGAEAFIQAASDGAFRLSDPFPRGFLPLPVDDPKVRQPDITKARRLLKWEPRVSLDAGLKLTVAYFRGRR